MLGLGTSLNHAAGVKAKFSKYSGSFDGAADFVKITKTAELRPTAAISISCWVKPNAWDLASTSDNDYFLGCVYSSGGWGVYLNSSGGGATTLNFIVRVSDAGSSSAGYITATMDTGTTEALSGWKNVVATYDGTTAKLYVNGSTTGVTNATSASGASIVYNAAALVDVMLGADAKNNTTSDAHNYYHGHLDDVAIFDDDLSAAEVTAIYNSGVPFDLTANKGDYASSGDLIGYWVFEEGTGNEVADSSTNSNDGGEGDPWSWSTDVPG